MPYSVEGKLVVAISSRALFDFEEENRVFDADGEPAYIKLQFERLDVPARPGVAFPLVKKLLAFNQPAGPHLVEVVVLSKNDPVSGLRVFRTAKQAGLAIERGVFTRVVHAGAQPVRIPRTAEGESLSLGERARRDGRARSQGARRARLPGVGAGGE